MEQSNLTVQVDIDETPHLDIPFAESVVVGSEEAYVVAAHRHD